MRHRHRILARGGAAGIALLMALVLMPSSAWADIKNPPFADMICSHFPGTGGLDTRTSCTNASNQITSAGYHGFNDVGVTAATAMGTGYALDDAIWAMFGHANTGFIQAYSSGGATTEVTADGSIWNWGCSGGNACLSGMTVAQLGRIKLMVFGGCYTANAAGSWILPKVAVQKGVRTAIGFTNEIYWPEMDTWANWFFYYAGVGNNGTLAAANHAEDAVYIQYNNYYGGVNTAQIWGNYTTSLLPVGYDS